MFHSPGCGPSSAESDRRDAIIPAHKEKKKSALKREKDNNDGDLGMSKNQAAQKLPKRRAASDRARDRGAKNRTFDGFARVFCGASARPQHHLDGG
jgi:hypothetical protein